MGTRAFLLWATLMISLRIVDSFLCRCNLRQRSGAAFSPAGRIFASMSSSDHHGKVALEVEQKFALIREGALENVEDQLLALEFTRTSELNMVDLYFDSEAPQWTLSTQDCWLRHREAGSSSSWQLKRGRSHNQGATVYEELEGDDAFGVALSMLEEDDSTVSSIGLKSEFDGHSVPEHPKTSRLVPFARIETKRTSWKQAREGGQFFGLTVDIDSTQYEYSVGEIECVVHDELDIAEAQLRIKSLLSMLVPDHDSQATPVGKLEAYLMKYKPAHYEACILGGSIERCS